MIFVLGVMIFVHELGHYAVAKWCGVRVETFSLGFGKRLWGFRRGDTDYRVSLLPLGGYVKMTGENPFEPTPDDPNAFMSHPRWQRFLIAIAGPAMNIVLAIALLTAVYMVRYVHDSYLEQPAKVGYVEPDSAADHAGIKPGDLITQLGPLHNPIWEDAIIRIKLSPSQPLNVTLLRDGKQIQTQVTPATTGYDRTGDAGLFPAEKVEVLALDETLPGAKAGLKDGDEIVALDGAPLISRAAIRPFLDANKDKPVEVSVLRDGKPLALAVTPVIDAVPTADGKTEQIYRIGFAPGTVQHVERLSFPKALGKSLEENKKFSLLIVELVQKLASHRISIRQMDGPVGIARASAEAATLPGWTPLMGVMSMISLNLGIFNLLPIPILDGGMILLLFIEGLMRRDISAPIKERIYQAAFVFLVLFACLVIYNDIAKNIGGLLP